jgi:Fe(3+) dicitrate transport protein
LELICLKLEHKFTNDADFSLQLFGLNANRKSVGYRSNRVSNPDTEGTVDLIVGDFELGCRSAVFKALFYQ